MHIWQGNDPLMEPKLKQFVYRYVVPNLVFIPELGNQSFIYTETWQLIQVSVLEHNTQTIQQATITITSIFSIHTIKS